MKQLEHKTILVTGANGFIGSHLARRLAGVPGVKLLLLSRQDAPFSIENARWIKTDLRHLTPHFWLAEGIGRIDCVFHLGAFTPKTGAQANSVSGAVDNILGTRMLLDSLPGEIETLVFSSTLDVYAPLPDGAVLTETSPTLPASLYGSSKLFCEHLVSVWAKAHGVDCAILRYGHIYGPGEAQYQKLIPVVLRNLLAHQAPVVHGDGSALRDYLFVGDAVEATLRGACVPGGMGPTNIVRGQSVSLKEIVELLIQISGSDQAIQFLKDKPNGNSLRFDSRLMVEMLGGWEMVGLEKGLAMEVASIKNMPQGADSYVQ